MITDLLFDPPWWASPALALVGIGIFIYANQRLKSGLRQVGVGVVVLSIIAYLVDTPREKVERYTRDFVSAVVDRNQARIAGLLHPNAMAYQWDKPQIVDGADYYAQLTGLTGVRVTSLRVEPVGTRLVSYLAVWSDHQGGQLPVNTLNSQWKLQWVRDGDHWLIREIIPLLIGQVQREQLEEEYFRRPARTHPRISP